MAANVTSRTRRAFELCQASFLSGLTLSGWIRMLRTNRWEVDAKYLPRAAAATLGACATSLLKIFEPACALDAESEEFWKRPVFVIGLGRSGTTLLFNLLAEDRTFCFPARLDCYNPHTFLVLRRLGLARLLSKVREKRRAMDNVTTGWLSPEEDQLAVQAMCPDALCSNPFSRRRDYVAAARNPYGESPAEKARFRRALRDFSRKLVFLHRRTPVLKSPCHTAAIPEILEVFPGARFVAIFRNPFAQFASAAALHRGEGHDFYALQAPERIRDDQFLQAAESVLRSYLRARAAIPQGQLVEVRYERLVADEKATLAEVYAKLGLGVPLAAPSGARRARYAGNDHPELPGQLKDEIRRTYRPFVECGLFSAEEMV